MGLLGGRFGSVDKAAFVIAKSQKKDGTWDFDKPVEVLFNPASIKISMSTPMKKAEGVANESTEKTMAVDGKCTPGGIGERQIEMTLIFSVVEDYLSKTQGSDSKELAKAAINMMSNWVGGSSFKEAGSEAAMNFINKSDYTSLSILNSQICCYSTLEKAASSQVPVMFYWGNQVFSGIIYRFSSNFNYFSSQGAPLGAEVTLTMISAVNDEKRTISVTTESLLGLFKKDGKLQREIPGS